MSKAARAVEIYNEEAALGGESLRKRCIARYKSELDMKDAGAGTYFQNTKKKLEGGGTAQLPLSATPKPKATVAASKAAPLPNVKCDWSAYTTVEGKVVTAACFADEASAQVYADQIEAQVINRELSIGDIIE